MRKSLALVALACALVGLGASIASLVDYFGPTFCSETGCATVRASAWSHPLGVPLPVLGIAYFAALIVVPQRRLRLALAVLGGASAIGLVALQALVIHAWCKLCLVADPAAIGVAAAVLAGAGVVKFTWPRAGLATSAVTGVVLATRLLHSAPTVPSGTPEFVARAQVAGQVTVVELVDFECPFCRALNERLAPVLERAPVRVVRKMVPLPMHAHAMPAALAYCCADVQGKGDAMAAALFAADPDELTPDGCERIAARVGCDVSRYRRDLPAMVGRVAAEMLDALGGGVRELPTVFVGGERLVGADHSTAELVAAINRARE